MLLDRIGGHRLILNLAWPDVEVESIEETGNTVVFADFKSSDDTK